MINLGTTSNGCVFLEGETDEIYFNKTIEVFDRKDNTLDFKWVGRINENRNAEFTGEKALDNTKQFILSNPQIVRSKVVLLYDVDTGKQNRNFDNLFVERIPLNQTNQTFKRGIENSLTLPAEDRPEEFHDTKTKVDEYSVPSDIRSLNKRRLCDWICTELPIEEQRAVLNNINELISRLNNFVQPQENVN